MKKHLLAVVALVPLMFSPLALAAQPEAVPLSASEVAELSITSPELEAITAGEVDQGAAQVLAVVVVLAAMAAGFAAAGS